jgi:hypothetical protein
MHVGGDPVADVYLAVVENVGAQTASVDEPAQHRLPRIPVDNGAGLAEANAAAADAADRELLPDKSVQLQGADDDVSAMLVGVERRVERLADLSLDERQRAPRDSRREGAAAADVPVAVKSEAGNRPCRLEQAAGHAPAGATQIDSTVPASAGGAGRGGRASAISAAAMTKPSSTKSRRTGPAPAGSQTTPEGTPYMTT